MPRANAERLRIARLEREVNSWQRAAERYRRWWNEAEEDLAGTATELAELRAALGTLSRR